MNPMLEYFEWVKAKNQAKEAIARLKESEVRDIATKLLTRWIQEKQKRDGGNRPK